MLIARFYAGHVLDPYPPASLCLVQAALKHGTDPMFIVASLALILDVLTDAVLIPILIRGRRARTYLVRPSLFTTLTRHRHLSHLRQAGSIAVYCLLDLLRMGCSGEQPRGLNVTLSSPC